MNVKNISLIALAIGLIAFNVSDDVSILITNFTINISGQPEMTDNVTLIAGDNITLLQDTANHTITISADSVINGSANQTNQFDNLYVNNVLYADYINTNNEIALSVPMWIKNTNGRLNIYSTDSSYPYNSAEIYLITDRDQPFSRIYTINSSGYNEIRVYSDRTEFRKKIILKEFTGTGDNNACINNSGELYTCGEHKENVLYDITLSSNVSSVQFDNLDINRDGKYSLTAIIYNPQTTDSYYYIYVNNNYVNTNYYYQYTYSNGTFISSSRDNYPLLAYCFAGENTYSELTIVKDHQGYLKYSGVENRRNTPIVSHQTFSSISTFTMSNITTLTINSSVTNAIGRGSRFILTRTT